MPKTVYLPDIGEVKLFRRRGARNLRISLNGNNEIRVTLPYYVPYATGVAFVQKKREWIAGKLRPVTVIENGQLIGKYHRLRIANDSSVTAIKTRLVDKELRVLVPAATDIHRTDVQDVIKRACIRALKQESEHLLPDQLATLAKKHGYTYRSVKTKQLKARWGSCSHERDIVLNVFLMTLPWQLIDYVLLHELIHTKVLSHGPDFWAEFERALPGAKQLRKQLKQYSPYF